MVTTLGTNFKECRHFVGGTMKAAHADGDAAPLSPDGFCLSSGLV